MRLYSVLVVQSSYLKATLETEVVRVYDLTSENPEEILGLNRCDTG